MRPFVATSVSAMSVIVSHDILRHLTLLIVVGFPGETEEEVSWLTLCRLGMSFIDLHSTIPSSSRGR